MSNRIAITVYVDIPDGLTPDVTYGNTPPVVAATIQTMDEPPLPDAPPPDMMVEARRIFADQTVLNAADPVCAIHGNTMKRWPAGTSKKNGKPFNASWRCSVQDCTTKPIWDRDAA